MEGQANSSSHLCSMSAGPHTPLFFSRKLKSVKKHPVQSKECLIIISYLYVEPWPYISKISSHNRFQLASSAVVLSGRLHPLRSLQGLLYIYFDSSGYSFNNLINSLSSLYSEHLLRQELKSSRIIGFCLLIPLDIIAIPHVPEALSFPCPLYFKTYCLIVVSAEMFQGTASLL